MEFIKVNLLYPNQGWRECVGDLVDPDDKKFLWSMCGKKYRGETAGQGTPKYFVDIAKGMKFYAPDLGLTYTSKDKITLEVLKSPSRTIRPEGRIRELGYAIEGDACSSDALLVCKDVVFYFPKNTLTEIPPSKSTYADCDVISYAKRNYEKIRLKISEFPTPQQIDDVLQRYKCRNVAKVLYSYIDSYSSE